MSALDQALKRLSHRPRSEMELKSYLFKKGFSGNEINEVIEKLLSWGYLNDEELIESTCRYQQSKMKSPAQIQQKLLQKFPAELVNEIMDDISDEYIEKAVDYQVSLAFRLNPGKDRQKIIRSLGQKGFPLDLIFRKLDRLSDEMEDEYDEFPGDDEC